MKSKKIVLKRYKITKTGKLMHRVQGRRHLRRNKSQSAKRRQDRPAEITTRKFVRTIKRFMEGVTI